MTKFLKRIEPIVKGGLVSAIIADLKFNKDIYDDLYSRKICIPDKDDHDRIIAAWKAFFIVAIFTAIIQIWDMIGEVVKKGDFGVLEKFCWIFCYRLPTECEVFIVALFEGIPQAAILLYLLFTYGIALRCPFPFKKLSVECLVMDLITSNSRFIMALSRVKDSLRKISINSPNRGQSDPSTSNGAQESIPSELNTTSIAIRDGAVANSVNEEEIENPCKECYCLWCCRRCDQPRKTAVKRGMIIAIIVLDIICLLALIACSGTVMGRIHIGPPLNYTRTS